MLAAIVIGAIGCYQFFVASSVDGWPINTSGMPYHSPAFWLVEILEASLLLGVLVNLGACFHTCKLVPGDMNVVDPRATDDAFCLVLPVCGERYSGASLTSWLQNRGAEGVESRVPVATVEAAHA